MNEQELEELLSTSDVSLEESDSDVSGAQIRQAFDRRRSLHQRRITGGVCLAVLLLMMGGLWQSTRPREQTVVDLEPQPPSGNHETSDENEPSTLDPSEAAVVTDPKLEFDRFHAELKMRIRTSRHEREAVALRQSIAELHASLDAVKRESRSTELQLLSSANQLASKGRDAELQELISLAPNSYAFKKYAGEEL